MTEEKPQQYDLDPDDAGPAATSGVNPPQLRQPELEPGKTVEPLPLEDGEKHGTSAVSPAAHHNTPEPPGSSKSSVKDLDVCPNCGAAMRGSDVLVCLRCGFDLKSMKVVKTLTGETVVEDEKTLAESQRLVKPGMGDLWLPGAIAAVGGLILLIGYLAGAGGLFQPTVTTTSDGTVHTVVGEISLGQRFNGLLQCIVLAGLWTVCGIGALVFVAHLLGLKLGDLKLAAMRMLGIVVAMRLVTLLDFPSRGVEWTIEAVLQAAVFVGLSIVLFKLKPRDAPTLGGAAVILFLVLWMAAQMLVWVTNT